MTPEPQWETPTCTVCLRSSLWAAFRSTYSERANRMPPRSQRSPSNERRLTGGPSKNGPGGRHASWRGGIADKVFESGAACWRARRVTGAPSAGGAWVRSDFLVKVTGGEEGRLISAISGTRSPWERPLSLDQMAPLHAEFSDYQHLALVRGPLADVAPGSLLGFDCRLARFH